MTVKELKQELEKYPETMDVFMAERKTTFVYGLLNSVRSETINFFDDESASQPLGYDTCVILDEE